MRLDMLKTHLKFNYLFSLFLLLLFATSCRQETTDTQPVIKSGESTDVVLKSTNNTNTIDATNNYITLKDLVDSMARGSFNSKDPVDVTNVEFTTTQKLYLSDKYKDKRYTTSLANKNWLYLIEDSYYKSGKKCVTVSTNKLLIYKNEGADKYYDNIILIATYSYYSGLVLTLTTNDEKIFLFRVDPVNPLAAKKIFNSDFKDFTFVFDNSHRIEHSFYKSNDQNDYRSWSDLPELFLDLILTSSSLQVNLSQDQYASFNIDGLAECATNLLDRK